MLFHQAAAIHNKGIRNIDNETFMSQWIRNIADKKD